MTGPAQHPASNSDARKRSIDPGAPAATGVRCEAQPQSPCDEAVNGVAAVAGAPVSQDIWAEVIRSACEQAWDECATRAAPHGGSSLVFLLATNPYRRAES